MSSARSKTQLVGKDGLARLPDSPINVAIERLRLRATLGTLSFEEPALELDNY